MCPKLLIILDYPLKCTKKCIVATWLLQTHEQTLTRIAQDNKFTEFTIMHADHVHLALMFMAEFALRSSLTVNATVIRGVLNLR